MRIAQDGPAGRQRGNSGETAARRQREGSGKAAGRQPEDSRKEEVKGGRVADGAHAKGPTIITASAIFLNKPVALERGEPHVRHTIISFISDGLLDTQRSHGIDTVRCLSGEDA